MAWHAHERVEGPQQGQSPLASVPAASTSPKECGAMAARVGRASERRAGNAVPTRLLPFGSFLIPREAPFYILDPHPSHT